MGSTVTLSAKETAAGASPTFPVTLASPGRLVLRNAGSALQVSLVADPGAPGDVEARTLSLPLPENGSVSLLVTAGRLALTLMGASDEETTACPELAAQVSLEAVDGPSLAALRAPTPAVLTLTPTTAPMTRRLVFSALRRAVTVFAKPPAPGLVSITWRGVSQGDAHYLVRGESGPPARSGRVLAYSGPSGWRFALEPEGDAPWPLERLIPVDLTVAFHPLATGTRGVIASVGQTQALTLGQEMTGTMALRNNATVDLQDITLTLSPWPAALAQAFARKGPVVGTRQPAGLTWRETVPRWRAGETLTWHWGTLIPRAEVTGTYGVGVMVSAARDHDVAGDAEGWRTEVTLARVNAQDVEHPDYESGIKIPVMMACAKKHPGYGAAFQACQDVLFTQRNACAARHPATSPTFVACVRQRLKAAAPDLLP